MEYAECFWSLAGVRGLGAKNFMRGTPFLDATWNADVEAMASMLRTFKSELETKGLSPDDTPLNDTDSFGHTLSQFYIRSNLKEFVQITVILSSCAW